MTCSKCSTEFEPDSHSDCTLLDETVCPRCTLSDGSLHRCDMVCQARSIKFIDHHPLTDGFMGFEVDKQVKVRNESGLHDPLITLEQHYELLRIFEAKGKNQKGPRKNGNPDYPLSNLITCDKCVGNSSIPRFVGYDHGNGKSKTLVYHKYRCRAKGCGRYLSREELHPKVLNHFQKYPITIEGIEEFTEALDKVWKQRDEQAKIDISRMSRKIELLRLDIERRAIAAIDPSNVSIKEELLKNIDNTKQEIEDLELELSKTSEKADTDKNQFLRFAFQFVNNFGQRFLEIPQDDRLRCKQIIFPAGFYLDADNNVYTPEISPLITLQTTKKDTEVSKNVQMVRVRGL